VTPGDEVTSGEAVTRGDAARARLDAVIASIDDALGAANQAREAALPACRRAIRTAGSSIRAVHSLDPARAAGLASECEAAIREAQDLLAPFPALAQAGYLHDAEKEFVEAVAVAALVSGEQVPGPDELPTAWMRGLSEAASELRRHLLDRLREGDLDLGEALLGRMDDVYAALVVVDYPDAVTNGLRRTLDALRAVLERSRGDVTTTVLQTRLQRAIEGGSEAPTA
jgi:translin